MDKSPDTAKAIEVLKEFTTSQCCGKCIACREGSRQMQLILESGTEPEPTAYEMQMLRELDELIEHTARCGLGVSIARQAMSWLNHQGMEKCPIQPYLDSQYHELLFFHIDPARCRGCSKCARHCPVGAITGKIKSPFTIDPSKCIKCGTCMTGCKFDAISIKE